MSKELHFNATFKKNPVMLNVLKLGIATFKNHGILTPVLVIYFYSHDLEYQTCILIHMMLINTYSDTSILIHVMNSVISIFWFLPECPHCTSLLSVAWQPQVRILC